MFKVIDFKTYDRFDHFNHFMTMENPFINITVDVDITNWIQKVKNEKRPFFLSFLYEVGKAANGIKELRQRILNGKIIEFDSCGSSYTVALPNGTYRYCNVQTNLDFDRYLINALKAQKIAQESENLVEHENPLSYFFISSLPWLTFKSLNLPYAKTTFSNPSITWGKYFTKDVIKKNHDHINVETRTYIPVSLMVNHALVDGIHISAFYESLEKNLNEI